MRLLVTAFEPFDGQPVNASERVLHEVEATWSGPAELTTAVLPVAFLGARRRLRALVAERAPDVVVCLGEAGGRAAVSIERVAVNVIDARIPDADGSAPVDVPVIAGGPAAYFTTLPIKACLAAVRDAGVPVEISQTAGTYVCNATFYALAHLLARTPAVRGGFVHVPRLPEQVTDGGPALGLASSARAVEGVLRAATGPAAVSGDARIAAGALH